MFRIVALFFTLCVFSVQAKLVISDATVRLLPPSVPNTSGYFTITNEGAEDRYLVAAASDIAKTVELHNHVMDGESMRMEKQERVQIPAGESIQFAPGGLHLMFFTLTARLTEGQTVSITLDTQQGEKLSFEANVVMPGKENQHSHHH